MNNRTKIYFLGSGPFAVPVLEKLVSSEKITLSGIATQPDKEAGRNKKLRPTPLGAWAGERGLEIKKISSVNSPEFINSLRLLAPDIILVVSFGQLLKEEILSLPGAKCVNIHASLLPLYRGSSPIAAAILNGDSKTGVCFMQMEKGLDTGPVYKSYELGLDGSEKAGELEIRLGQLAAEYCEETLGMIADSSLKPETQDPSKACFAGKVKKEYGKINWADPAEQILRKVRAYNPWPGAFFHIKPPEKPPVEIKILDAELLCGGNAPHGEVLFADRHGLAIACGKDAIVLRRIVPESKKEMSGEEFVRGCRFIEKGTNVA